MQLNLKATPVFEKNNRAKTRIVVNQGGTRSSKTYSLAQLFVIRALQEKNHLFTISRKTLPALKATAMRDVLSILKELDLYDESNHNKTDYTYKLGSNEIEFVAVDQPQKIRGRKRNTLWLNEANEFSLEDFRQLSLRTTGQIFMDFNPSDEFHWIYEDILNRDDVTFIKSTYLDNPFLPPETIKEIERLKKTDENYWRVYGLGERGATNATIYNHWQYCEELPKKGEEIFGLDFGFNNPTALARVEMYDEDVYAEEVLYESFLTNSELIARFETLEISKNAIIYADSAEPQRIEEIRQAGYNVRPADKAVEKGVDNIKSRAFYITKESVNMQKEASSYKWKVRDGKPLDEPVKANDHLMDAIRYAVHTHSRAPFVGFA